MKILRKENSVADWGTYTSNAIVVGNTNALKDVESESYNQIKEFFGIQTDAFLVSAAMDHFGMETTTSKPTKNCFSSELCKTSSIEDKRKWLFDQTAQLFDCYVADSVSDISEASTPPPTSFPCRFVTCSRVFKYAKCRINHEKMKHHLTLNESVTTNPQKQDQEIIPRDNDDHIYNYGCLNITLGLMIRDAEDSVQEGDGERLLRVSKFLTYIFRLTGCFKYALAGLRLIASINGLLTPREAHRLTWNRFAGVKTGPGKRISRDLRVEQLNKIAKEEIRALGFPNINDESVVKATKVTAAVEKMINASKSELEIKEKSGHHCNRKTANDFETILHQVNNKAKVR